MENDVFQRRQNDRSFLRPVDARYALALLGTIIFGSGAVIKSSHDNDAITREQATALGEARTRYEQAIQHCNERESDRTHQDLSDLRREIQGNR